MSSAKLRLKRLESILILSARITGESSGGLLGDALDATLDATAAFAGAAFGLSEVLEQVAERGLPALGDADPIRGAMRSVARRAVTGLRPIWLRDLRAGQHAVKEAGVLAAAGARAGLVLPISYRRTALGALVLLFDDPAELDEETAGFCETVAHVLALALDRERLGDAEAARRAEAERAERRATTGLLAASVAHELHAPVGALVLQLEEQENLLRQLELLGGPSDTALGVVVAELTELTRDIGAAVAHLRRTAEQLASNERRQQPPEPIDLSTVVRDALAVARPHLERRGIELIEQLTPGCTTTGQPDDLGQVVLNLVFNAAEACERAARPHPQVTVRTVEGPLHTMLAVDDNGPGVADPKLIFQPFYTTKSDGRGVGLGLKICSEVVAAHGGHVEVVCRPEGGASFQVFLPRPEEESGVYAVAPSAPPTASPKPLRSDSRRSILVVDDDPLLSRSLRRSLRGHEVRTCSTASEAEIMLLGHGYRPDVILCDVFLPGANGNALHSRIVERDPELASRFIFMTGGALGKQEADYIRRSECRTLFKPLGLEDVRDLVEPVPDSAGRRAVRTLGSSPAWPRIPKQ
ncbi:MAG: ATP-binding protein [Sorangiineae bacterium]|nr:ATP-binding protein [Polyangiaceae bacterium]MEB2324517.1 ATP-binding protein [Sorangiineae bacterium]